MTSKATTPRGFSTAVEICELLGIHEQTLARWIKAGLPTHQPIRRGRRLFVRAEVLAWVQSRCITPKPDQAPNQEGSVA